MSIDSVLAELVSQVEGATGAILVAADGEAVQWHPPADGERLRLRGAYLAVALQGWRASAVREKVGAMRCLVLEYEGSSFAAQEVDSDCFVVLEVAASANIGQAVFRVGLAAAKLRIEIVPQTSRESAPC